MCKSFLYNKRIEIFPAEIQCFPGVPSRHKHTLSVAQENHWERNSRTGKNKESFKFYGVEWCRRRVLFGGVECERKILAGKRDEKCNKFYYYDVFTSLVCIKNSSFGACGVRKVNKHRLRSKLLDKTSEGIWICSIALSYTCYFIILQVPMINHERGTFELQPSKREAVDNRLKGEWFDNNVQEWMVRHWTVWREF